MTPYSPNKIYRINAFPLFLFRRVRARARLARLAREVIILLLSVASWSVAPPHRRGKFRGEIYTWAQLGGFCSKA